MLTVPVTQLRNGSSVQFCFAPWSRKWDIFDSLPSSHTASGLFREYSLIETLLSVAEPVDTKPISLPVSPTVNIPLDAVLAESARGNTEFSVVGDRIAIGKPGRTKATTDKRVRYITCRVCHLLFYKRDQYREHMRLHANDPSINIYSCDHCSFVTKRRGVFQTHTLRHTGDLPFKCNQCDYAGRQVSLLRQHMQNKHPSTRNSDSACEVVIKQADAESSSVLMGNGEMGWTMELVILHVVSLGTGCTMVVGMLLVWKWMRDSASDSDKVFDTRLFVSVKMKLANGETGWELYSVWLSSVQRWLCTWWYRGFQGFSQQHFHLFMPKSNRVSYVNSQHLTLCTYSLVRLFTYLCILRQLICSESELLSLSLLLMYESIIIVAYNYYIMFT